ncbi:MAG TPA: FHA domain-containing protein, partial [Polyangiaceae bacterium]|nr:FHA domain-containing protein [Polyangiaceae bacterium]
MSDQPSDVTTQVMDQPAKLEYPRIELVVVEGPDTGLRRTLAPTGMRIGTAPSNELPLKDRTVSRFHCEVRIAGTVARLVDSGSTNGTFVDGVCVHDAELSTGSKVRVGATVLSVSASGERALVDLSPRHSFGDVLGVSVEMRRLYAILEKIAPTDTTVLIQGETGAGKELVARAIHDSSARASQPFVVVDCGAIAEN